MPSARSRLKITLRIVVLALIVLFIALQIYVRLPPLVRLKSLAERQRLPVAKDFYPCLMVERAQGKESLSASISKCESTLHDDSSVEQYEVDLRSGLFVLRHTDLYVADDPPLAMTRAYNPWDLHSRAFGVGGNHSYDIFPTGDHYPYTYMNLNLGDGEFVRYERISRGTGYADFIGEHLADAPARFQASTVRWNRDHWELTLSNGKWIGFPDSYQATRAADGAPFGIRNGHGSQITLIRDGRHNLIRLISPRDHQIEFSYDANDRIVGARSDQGKNVDYSYNQNGRLNEVREDGRTRWLYVYDLSYLISIQSGDRRTILSNQYSRGRITRLAVEGGGTYRFDYLVSAGGKVDETVVTDPSGKATSFLF
jgi:YD repeat-containing protein